MQANQDYYELSREYQRVRLAEADRMRLVKCVLRHHPARDSRFARFYKPSLHRLGRALVMIGTGLQVRYGGLAPVSLSDSDCHPGMAC